MILLCQVFIFQLLSGLCGGFGWFGYSAYTTSRPRTVKPDRPVVYENPVAEVFGYQSYKPSQQVYTTKKSVIQPYQSFFHQGYTTTMSPKSTTMKPKLTTKKPKQVVLDPLVVYPNPASQIYGYQSHGSFEPSQQPDRTVKPRPAKPHAVHTEENGYESLNQEAPTPKNKAGGVRQTIYNAHLSQSPHRQITQQAYTLTSTTKKPSTAKPERTEGYTSRTALPYHSYIQQGSASNEPAMYTTPVTTAMYTTPVTTAMCTTSVIRTVYTSPVTPAMYTSSITPVMYTTPVTPAMYTTSQIDLDHGEPAAFTRQSVSVTTTRLSTSRGSNVVNTNPAAYRQPVYLTTLRPTTSGGFYEVTTRPAVYTRQPVSVTTTRPAVYTRQPVSVTTSRPTSSRGSYVVTIRPAAYLRQPVEVTTTRPTTNRGSYEVTTRQVASQYEPVTDVPKPSTHGYETRTGGSTTPGMDHYDTMAMSFDSRKFIYDVEMEADLYMLPSYWYSTKHNSEEPEDPFYEIASRPAAYMRQPVDLTTTRTAANTGQPVEVPTTRPTTSSDSYEVTARPAASHYEPVTDVPKPSTPGYETLTVGSTPGTDHSAFDSKRFNFVEMEADFDILPSYWYYSKQDGSNNIDEPEDDYSSSRSPGGLAGPGPLSALGLTGYKPLSSLEYYNPVSSLTDYKPVSSLEDYKPLSSLDNYNHVSSLPGYKPESSLPGYKPVLKLRGYSEVTTRKYEPVTGVTTPSTQDYTALSSGMLPNYSYSSATPSKQDVRKNTEEPNVNPSSSQTSFTSPLSVLGLADYKPVLSSGFMERSFPETGNSPPFCHTEERVEFLDQCETYKEETCNTINKEKCRSQVLSDCRPVLKTRVEEVCLNVTNKVCTLVESEEKVKEEEFIFISSCSRVMEQVCDQSYEMEVTDQEQELCVDLETDCIQENITVLDTVCVEGVEFNCQQDVNMKENVCEKIVKENCMNTPREVTVTSCQPTSTLCHNLTSQQAVPIMTEVCRDQPTAVCRLVEDVKLVERKVYTYSVSCNMKEQEECKLVEKKKLETICSEQERPVCDHNLGEEECVEEDKEFCHQVEKVVEVEVCDDEFQTYEI